MSLLDYLTALGRFASYKGLDQCSLEKRIAYLTESGVLDNIPSHGKYSFGVEKDLWKTLFSHLPSHHEIPSHTNKVISLSKHQKLNTELSALKLLVLEQL